MNTAGEATELALQPDRATIAADGRDLSFVTVSVVDGEGQAVPRSSHTIRFEVSGPGEIVATDNGDPTDRTVFQSTERKAFSGLALAIVRARPGEPGTIVVNASAAGLTAASTSISAQ